MSQQPQIDWLDHTVPVSRTHADPYFSRAGGLAETRHVFLAGTGLPEGFRPGFHIAELGFGTGLNMLAALAEWQAAGVPGRLRYTGFELHPLPPEAIARALGAFPELAPLTAELLRQWQQAQEQAQDQTGRDTRRLTLPGLDAEVLIGDARTTLPHWQGRADAWFLDGFAPARNPELWEPALLAEVARHSRPGARLATYSAAGAVRRALQAAGFSVARVPGFAGKRHMTVAGLAGKP